MYGKIELNPTHGFSCFFIVEHIDDKEFIKDQALQLLLSGCRNFDFYGKKKDAWHFGVDEADMMLYPNMTYETVALTSGWVSIEEFVEELHYVLSQRPFLPHDYYLLYDDHEIYQNTLELLDNYKR